MNCSKLLITAALLALSTAGCGSEEETAPPADEPASVCEEFDTPYEDITIGLTKAGEDGDVKVAIVALDPAVPIESVENTWTVQLLDGSDAPLSSAEVTEVQPFMPEHGHGSQEAPTVGATDADGQVEIGNLFFQMPGVWTVTFTVDDGAGSDQATFGLCIEG